jgi:hypothetical protein
VIRLLASLVLRLAGWLVVLGLLWRLIGVFGVLMSLPLLGLLVARTLVDLGIEVHYQVKHAHWRHLEGRHYAFRGNRVSVFEDGQHRRWVRLADVRAIAGFTASDGALAITYRDGVRSLGRPAEPHIADEALLAHLAKERSPDALRLRRWVEREIVFPARRQRERLGRHAAEAGTRAATDSGPRTDIGAGTDTG